MASQQKHQCPLCGYRFDAAALTCKTSCPLSSTCSILCCPNCGYRVPDENRMGIAGALKRAWETRLAKHEEGQG